MKLTRVERRCNHGFLRSRSIKCPKCDCKATTSKLPRNLAGIRFGKVVCVDIANKGVAAEAWRCLCDCGEPVVIGRISLLRAAREGRVSSCPACRTSTAAQLPATEHPFLDFPTTAAAAPAPARERVDRLGPFRLTGAVLFDTLSVLVAVAESFKLSVEELRSNDRHRHCSEPRAAAYWLLVRHSLMSLSSVARTLGKRDHTTVLNGLQRCAQLRESNSWYRAEVDEIERKLEQKAKGTVAA